MTPTLDAALLCCSRLGSDLGRMSDWFEELILKRINDSFIHSFILSAHSTGTVNAVIIRIRLLGPLRQHGDLDLSATMVGLFLN